jgi:hypothetical protein
MPKNYNKNFLEYLLVIFAIFVLAAIATQTSQPAACTEEAMLCPDGTAVGRTGPDCSFAPCPICRCPEGFEPSQDGRNCIAKCNPGEVCHMLAIQCISNNTCQADSDCVPAQCCHPTSCMNKAFKGVCNLACTLSCETPLDCGQASCACVDNVCSVKLA